MGNHNPPKEREKKALDYLAPIIEALDGARDKLETSISSPSGITYGFAQSGIRVNRNREASYNLMDVLDVLEECGDPEELRGIASTVERVISAAKEVRRGFEACPECSGKRGAKGKPPPGYTVGHWEDCCHCLGRGLVVKEAYR